MKIKSDMLDPVELNVRSPHQSSIMYCPECGHNYTQAESRNFITNGCWDALCPDKCITPMPYVQRSSAYALNPDKVRGAMWYHGTLKEHWYQDILFPQDSDMPLVHIGTKRAAMRRLQDHRQAGIYRRSSYLFKMSLDAQATVSPYFVRDNSFMDVRFETISDTEYDIIRYVNLWESPGSISLIVRPSCINIQSREVVV